MKHNKIMNLGRELIAFDSSLHRSYEQKKMSYKTEMRGN